jgi:hypothetical protein
LSSVLSYWDWAACTFQNENTNGVHAYNPCSQEDEAGGL